MGIAVGCLNRGYQMPDERKSRLAQIFRRFLMRRKSEDKTLSPVRALSAMEVGQSGKVIPIDSQDYARIDRLTVLGLVPDARVKLEQKYPT